MDKLSDNVEIKALISDKDLSDFLHENTWMDSVHFDEICRRYGFPDNSLTIVVENYYIDAAYRNMYYNCWSAFHFNWPRHCRRVFLFQNEHYENHFFNQEYSDNLKQDFLGAIVVRPSYSDAKDHTFGKTLLNPQKMVCLDANGCSRFPFLNAQTAEYKLHLLGNTYSVDAFPFSSQDGMFMKCAETAVYNFCDFAATSSPLYARVLPSNILEKLRKRLSERVLPSHGLYNKDISYLLKEFGFSPMLYADNENLDHTGEMCIGQDGAGEVVSTPHPTGFKDWFRYYVESSLPIIVITAPNQEVCKHASLVIGRGLARNPAQKCTKYYLGELPCIDATELYEDYIVQDDNQIPYCTEKIDHFTKDKNYKLEAFIVPLAQHVFLDAPSAISIFDNYIMGNHKVIKSQVNSLVQKYYESANSASNIQAKEQFKFIANAMTVTEDNPITIRYYLADSAEYKKHRFVSTDRIEEKKFYSGVSMPKSVWVAEISTYNLYKQSLAFAEVVLDATAAERFKVNSIILLRTANSGLYRNPDEEYNKMMTRMERGDHEMNLAPIFTPYHHLGRNEWDISTENVSK